MCKGLQADATNWFMSGIASPAQTKLNANANLDESY